MYPTIEYLEPEAFQPEWEEAQALKAQPADDAENNPRVPADVWALFVKVAAAEQNLKIMEQAAKEMLLIKSVRKQLRDAQDGDHKYARLARQYVASLRRIFWHGHFKKQAQTLLEELQLEATVPMSDLDTAWYQDGDKMLEVDSYTQKPMEDEDPQQKILDPWRRDAVEVQEYMRLCEEANGYMVEADESVMELLVNMALADMYTPPVTTDLSVPVIYYPPSDDARYTTELLHLGYDAETIKKADKAQFDLAGGEDEIVYIDQLDEAMLKGAVEQMAADGADPAEVKDIKILIKARMDDSGVFALYKAAYAVSSKYLSRQYPEPTEEQILSNIWNNRFGRELRDVLHYLGYSFKPASLALAFLSSEEWEPIAALVPVPIYGQLSTFIDLFGDVLLDEAFAELEDRGLENTENGLMFMATERTDTPIADDWDPRVDALAKQWEEELILLQYEEDPVDDQGRPLIEYSRAYARGWFAALAKNESDLRGAGYAAWRWWKSKAGAKAYDQIMAEESKNFPDDKAGRFAAWAAANKKAMRSFWNAGKIVYLRQDNVDIKSEANGKIQTVNWGLASWKLTHHEIDLTDDERQRLKAILQDKGWGRAVIKLL